MTEEQYTQAESFWTRKDETEKKLDADTLYQWIDEFLSSHKVLALATAAEDFVRCTPLEYSWHDGALWIFTEGGLKFRALRKNKHVAAAVFDVNATFGGCEATLCHPHRRRFEIFRNSDGSDALTATRRLSACRGDALSLPCLMPGNSSRHKTRP